MSAPLDFPQPYRFNEQRFAASTFPALPTLSLSEADRELVTVLGGQPRGAGDMMLSDAFYRGEQIIADLGIAIPREISNKLRCLVGWPRQAVDPYVDRLAVDGFRLPSATDADGHLADMWAASRMGAELPILLTDVLAMGRGYLTVGSPTEPTDPARICVESPLNMNVLWDTTGRVPRAALQTYQVGGRQHAALYAPDRTIQLAQNDRGQWEIVDRDDHGFGLVPIVRVANNPRSVDRDGFSEVTPELRSVVASACRTLLGLEVAGQLYAVPRQLILGATESDFQDANGNAKAAWDTYISSVLALERDEEGNLPEIKQLQAYDPATFTKVIEMYASQAAGILAAPPQDLGLYTSGNPVSTESWAASEGRRDRRAVSKQRAYTPALVEVMQLAARFENNGELPAEFRRMEVDWHDVSVAVPGVIADAITKQIAAGSIPPTSDVTLKRLGYSAVERSRLEVDRKVDAGAAALAELASTLQPKQPQVAGSPIAQPDVAASTPIPPAAAGGGRVQPAAAA